MTDLNQAAPNQEHWKVQVVLGHCKQHLASWSQPEVHTVSDGEHGEDGTISFGSPYIIDVEAHWIDDPAYGEMPGFIKWPDVSAITWKHYVPPVRSDPEPDDDERVKAPPIERMLAAIKAQDGQTLRELAALTDMRVSTASQVLSTLKARGQARCEEQENGPWRWHLTELSKVVRPSKRRRF